MRFLSIIGCIVLGVRSARAGRRAFGYGSVPGKVRRGAGVVSWYSIPDRIGAPTKGARNRRVCHFIFFCSCALPLPCVAAAGVGGYQPALTNPSALRHASDRPAATQPQPEGLELSREQALWAALAFEDTDKLSSLLKQGVDPNKPEELSQMTPIMAAETLPVAKILVEAGADPRLRDRAGRTALHHAAKMREGAAIVELLVRNGADVNARANDGAEDTPLHCAIENYLEVQDRQQAALIIRVLIHLGADINRPNARGDTALVLAATHNQPDLIRLLLELGADASRPANGGRTPLDFARDANATEAIQALASAPSKPVPAN
jgi:ankyrin repeat protein